MLPVALRRLRAARLVGGTAVAVLGQFAVDAPGGYFGPADRTTPAGIAFLAAALLLCVAAVALLLAHRRLFALPGFGLFGLIIFAFLPPLGSDPVVAGSVVLWNLLLFATFLFERGRRPVWIGGTGPSTDRGPVGPWLERNGAAMRHLLGISLAVSVAVLGYRFGVRVPAQVLCVTLGASTIGFSIPYLLQQVRHRPTGPVAVLLLLLGGAAFAGSPEVALSLLAAGQAVVLGMLWAATPLFSDLLTLFYARPAYLLVMSFLVLIALGTLFLSFPEASAVPGRVGPLDALFTATSATCVTGLIVLDTPNDFSSFGHVVILVLIQAGGLNMMVLSAFAALLLGRDLGLRGEGALGEVLDVQRGSSAQRLVVFIVVATLFLEACGAAVLWAGYARHGYQLAEAAWYGVFHAISAFCNAGFSLHSDSLVRFQDDPLVLLTVAGLITLGGLGFTVLAYLWSRIGTRKHRVAAVQARIVISASALLVVAGAVLFAAAELNRSLAGLDAAHKALNAVFQSVTLRTAGFNSVALDALHPVTILTMMAFMFIGASPGGTGGGIKTTTALVLIGSVLAILRRQPRVTLFRHSIPLDTVYRSAAIAVLSSLAVLGGCAAMLGTQLGSFQALVFEAFSAFGTVGLSLGATAGLDAWGKLAIIAVMLVGRVGPLTLALFLGREAASRVRYPDARIMVG